MSSWDAAAVCASCEDGALFAVVFDRYHREVWRFLAATASVGVADDLTSVVFIEAFRGRGQFDPDRGTVRAWLFGIARNVARQASRSEARRWRLHDRFGRLRESAADVEQDVVDAGTVARETALVRAALRRLRANDREVLVLAVWEGLSYEEIAVVLSVPVGTVRSRLHRARRRLRELAGLDGEEHHSVRANEGL